jgi:hypothetical protein
LKAIHEPERLGAHMGDEDTQLYKLAAGICMRRGVLRIDSDYSECQGLNIKRLRITSRKISTDARKQKWNLLTQSMTHKYVLEPPCSVLMTDSVSVRTEGLS